MEKSDKLIQLLLQKKSKSFYWNQLTKEQQKLFSKQNIQDCKDKGYLVECSIASNLQMTYTIRSFYDTQVPYGGYDKKKYKLVGTSYRPIEEPIQEGLYEKKND